MPVIRLAKAARTAPAGTVIILFSTDPAAEPDVAAWCRMRGQELLEQKWLDERDRLDERQQPDEREQPDDAENGRRVLRSRIRIADAQPAEQRQATEPAG